MTKPTEAGRGVDDGPVEECELDLRRWCERGRDDGGGQGCDESRRERAMKACWGMTEGVWSGDDVGLRDGGVIC